MSCDVSVRSVHFARTLNSETNSLTGLENCLSLWSLCKDSSSASNGLNAELRAAMKSLTVPKCIPLLEVVCAAMNSVLHTNAFLSMWRSMNMMMECSLL